MYTRPQVEEGEATTFGVSGKLWREALVMYDRRSRSLWSQIDGRAKAGPLTGQVLTKIPSQVTTWAVWKAKHPATRVLVKPPLERSAYASYHDSASWVGLPWARGGRDPRLPAKTLVLGVELAAAGETNAATGSYLAVRWETLTAQRLVQGTVHDQPILVASADDPRAALAYHRTVGDRILEFAWRDQPSARPDLVDLPTGSTWDWLTGEAIDGPLLGTRLEPLPTTPIYWSTWIAFHPETALW